LHIWYFIGKCALLAGREICPDSLCIPTQGLNGIYDIAATRRVWNLGDRPSNSRRHPPVPSTGATIGEITIQALAS
jgi:hypothetical protein